MTQTHWHLPSSVVEKPKWYHFSRPLHFIGALGGVGLILFLGWFFLSPSPLKEETIPLIQAQPGPIRIRPDSAEVPDIPHQDKLIYDELTGKYETLNETSSRAPVETPLEREDAFPEDLPLAEALKEGEEEGGVSPLPQDTSPFLSRDLSSRGEKEIKITLSPEDLSSSQALQTKEVVPLPNEKEVSENLGNGVFEGNALENGENVALSSEEIEERTESPKLRSLPLSKLFSLDPPSKKNPPSGGKHSKPPFKQEPKKIKKLPFPKSQERRYAHLTPWR